MNGTGKRRTISNVPRSVLRIVPRPPMRCSMQPISFSSAKALPSLAALGKKNCGRRMNAPISSSEYASSGRARRPRFDAIVAIRCASKGLPSCSMRQTTSEPSFSRRKRMVARSGFPRSARSSALSMPSRIHDRRARLSVSSMDASTERSRSMRPCSSSRSTGTPNWRP